MAYYVIVDHVSLEPGKIGKDRIEVSRHAFRDPRNAAALLHCWIEHGQEALCIPPRRHGRFYIIDTVTGYGKQWALVPFCREHKITEFLKREERK